MQYKTDDVNIAEIKELLPPIALLERYEETEKTEELIYKTRKSICNIIENRDSRLLVIVGPCSIHDPVAALVYAEKLCSMREELKDTLEIVMRVYFEKPRTTVGWKGLINDPFLDNSFQINHGLRTARKLLLDINTLGLPCAVEYLDMITPQYIADLISWGAIGARTTESQVHRELASGLSCPVGFKNGTNGSIDIAIEAMKAAAAPHHFLSVTKYGHSAIVATTGNKDSHIILRGGKGTPNYTMEYISKYREKLATAGLPEKIMIDCSHANSNKVYTQQLVVGDYVGRAIAQGEESILGVMIESNLVEGRQNLIPGEDGVFGQSITDPCLGWKDTTDLLYSLSDSVKRGRIHTEV
ncbi:3-deoxy-7-phosphoheptulonate synthase AroG [Chitinivibrio alkaliphilus]|uniref:Phospho-2-dehydro-3-deoxyheptonate aldolase n=1 Tax=Chitinivibrio alkaliphilus ACht1 TaxID=1313304 RepID=U7D605_9BACT|nr:3-deoxy-7-phosphoheptulonate synthase AroG [Chitinivibrio alkaliphilus]ERP31944.1 2-keto-3-deoxy-D-arabino-heptulosonate-7-phosphate synthase I alpha [Chitinivibrio alkaliphilus ACht1]